ncbi:MAG: hypothetical protein JNK09_07910 [Prolixibacteraceae bacterium]|nr:hypothetical protein [Prolixibacteraceae bacterium]
MEDFRRGLLLTTLLSIALLFLFFGPLLKDPNHVYFSPSGDGLKSYTGAIYHLEHDTTMFRMNAMNYPYGEMAFFTDCQPMIVNPVKKLANIGLDFRLQIVGIINLFMLISIVLAAIFICLIFLELKVSWWFAAVASVGITLLSPQIGRLGGHFSLAHLMWLPMLVWLLMRFDKNKTYLLSGIIGLVTFFAAGMHMYFFALFGFLFLFYWAHCLLTSQMNFKNYKWALHLFIQLILPLILVQFIVGSNDTIADRTTHPWGFFNYKANPASVLLPIGKPYAKFLTEIKLFRNMEWEAFAYVGMVSLIGFIAGIFLMIRRVVDKQQWWKVSDYSLINVFFWSSVASLLLSFSIPFNLGLHFLLEYLGPIQQLRALSRFSWLFYYLINILVFYGIFKLMKQHWPMKIMAGLALIFLFYDGYLNVKVYAPMLNNRVPELEDVSNSSPENAWVSQIDVEKYQAVLPLPYFHVGSENVWREPKCDILRQSFIVSLKSGLPSMGVMLSRTSLSQTYKSLSLVSNPVSPFLILNDLPSQKPLLLMVENCNDLTPPEKNLVQHSSLVWQGPKFAFYQLPLANLNAVALDGEEAFRNEMNTVYEGRADSAKLLYFNGFENNPQKGAFQGVGAFSGEIKNWNRVLEEKIKNGLPGDTCEILFWVKGYETDLMPRSIFEFVQKNGEETVDYKYDQFQHFYCALKDGWMRIRIPFVLKSANDLVMLSIRNGDLKHFQLLVDDVIIRK